MVMHSLSSEFTLLRVVNGEAVAAHNLGVANGFVKPKLGERQPAGAAGSLAPRSQSFIHRKLSFLGDLHPFHRSVPVISKVFIVR